MSPLSQERFDNLLARLDPNRERAALRYEAVRAKLVTFFRFHEPTLCEELADQAVDRVANKLEGEEIRSVEAFALGVARNIVLEQRRSPEMKSFDSVTSGSSLDCDPESEIIDKIDAEKKLACVRACMAALSSEDRSFIMDFYDYGDSRIEKRRSLVRLTGLKPGALRIRAFRVRRRLEECVRGCLRAGAAGSTVALKENCRGLQSES